MSAEWQFLVTLNERLRPLRNPVEIQEAAVRLLGEHLHANRVNYSHVDGDEFVISRTFVDGGPPFPPRGPLARFGEAVVAACRRGETVAVSDAQTDPRFTEQERAHHRDRGTAAFVGVPLIKNGRWIATLGVHSATPRVWTFDQIALIEVTAERAWGAGERARAEEALGRTENRQAFLRRLSDTVRPLANPAHVLAETCRLLGVHLGVDRVSYGEINGDECVIVSEYAEGLPPQATRFRWSAMGASRTAEILDGGAVLANDTLTEWHTAEERAALQAAGISAYLCPLLVKDGRFVGAFGIHSRAPRVWTADEVTLVQEVADRIWATLEHRKAEAELRANEDRLAFLLRLNDALRPLVDPAAVLDTAARLVGEHFGCSRVGYAEIGERNYVIRGEYTRDVPPLSVHGTQGTFGAALSAAYRRGETVVVNDVASDSRFTEAERVTMAERQMAAFVGITLIKGGRLVAAFGANNVTPRVWTPAEIALVRDVAERTWDAVERVRAEAALREREHRFRLALAASGGGSWTWDARTNHIDWDDVFRTQFGFSLEEPPAFETWLARVHDEDRPRLLADLAEVQQSKDTWDNTYRIVRPDGTVTWLQSLGRADRDADGHLTRLTGLELDITERRRTEEALQALREEEHDRELHFLLETATQGIVSVDAQGTIVMANRALEAMFGWAHSELIGQSIERLLPSASLRGSKEGGGPLVVARKDGSTFPIEVSLNYVAGGGSSIAFVTDITERQRAASALQERTDELEYRTGQLRRMAWDLTLAEHHAREQIARTLHDGVQQLLFIVSLNLDQQLQRDIVHGDAPSELLSEAKLHLDEATAAARSLHLELFPPVLQRSGLPAALTWLANWTQEKYRMTVRVDAHPLADTARKDIRTLLFESARELLFNAFKHAHADGVTLELGLSDDGQLSVTVTDNGVGFEPATLDARSRAGQLGWGLFSLHERLTLLGGRVDIHSAPGCGTRVRLLAPRDVGRVHSAATIDARRAPLTADAPEGRVAPSNPLRILIVDDHAALRSALRELLSNRPHLAVIGDASNGLEAIAHAYRLRPDVILMDVAMPQMDGVEATARIRAELPDIEILGLSMQVRSEAVHPIERAGAAAYFVKGIDTQRLLDHLQVVHASRGGDRAES